MKHENLDKLSILIAVVAVAAAVGLMSLTGKIEEKNVVEVSAPADTIVTAPVTDTLDIILATDSLATGSQLQ